jgi:hypothetical protein
MEDRMSNDTKDVDRAIAAYRRELVAEAELAAEDLDEIEDHLRTLTADLRATGLPAAAAVTEAARRVGDPRRLAREHARVRSPFGAQLSRLRAWSAALVLAPMLVIAVVETLPHTGLWSRYMAELGFGLVLAAALVARLSWARSVLLGGLAFFAIPTVMAVALAPESSALWLVPSLGPLAFLVPWRRGEVTRAGTALALSVWAYGAASLALGYQLTASDGSVAFVAPVAVVALVAAMIATVGGILRARWSAAASAVCAATLAFAIVELAGMRFVFDDAALWRVYLLGMVGSGVVAAAASAYLAHRTARSGLGTFDHVLR